MRDFKLVLNQGEPEMSFGTHGVQVYMADTITASFTRSEAASKQDGSQVASNTPRFEEGVYGKALMLEEGTTNLLTNPRMDIDTTGWLEYWHNTLQVVSASPSGDFPQASPGCFSFGIASGYLSARLKQDFTSAGDIWMTFSVWLYVPDTVTVGTVCLRPHSYYGDGNTLFTTMGYELVVPERGVWVRKSLTFLTRAAAYLQRHNVEISINNGAIGETIYCLFAQLEQKKYPTSFISAVRNAELCAIPAQGVMNSDEGTVELVYIPTGEQSEYARLFECGSYSQPVTQPWLAIVGGSVYATRLEFAYFSPNDPNNILYVHVDLSQSNAQIGVPYYVAVRWANGQKIKITVQVNGVAYSAESAGSLNSQDALASLTTINIGGSGSATEVANALIQNVSISQRMKTDAEIATAASRSVGITENRQIMMTFNNTLVSEVNSYPLPGYISSIPSHLEVLPGSEVAPDNRDCSNNIFLSLAILRGSWWFNPAFGMRDVRRLKNTARTAKRVKDYAEEALQWLLDIGRCTRISVAVDRDPTRDPYRLKLLVEAEQADGLSVSYTTFKEVV